jgi:hypothetical protein
VVYFQNDRRTERPRRPEHQSRLVDLRAQLKQALNHGRHRRAFLRAVFDQRETVALDRLGRRAGLSQLFRGDREQLRAVATVPLSDLQSSCPPAPSPSPGIICTTTLQ